ncbi:MAG: 3-hydroxyacyl-CoA dehydrogenase [Alphaproteobacteria bacterium]|nr:3-hydroxyacyl-CoA dehydrogenase [Alphaproteobacteria bacterium]
MQVVSHALEGAVLVITVDNPPVNALSHAVREGIVNALSDLPSEAEAVLIVCAGRTFIAGADISEFGKPPLSPGLADVLEALENCPLPVVAAIHGQALGGGLELSLACDYRVLDSKARVGLPEVNLGLIPGAGGTQRLQRLAGVDTGLKLAVSGKPISANEALDVGIADAVFQDQLVTNAVAFAAETAKQKRCLRDAPAPPMDTDAFDRWTGYAHKKMRGQAAPLAVIDAVRHGLENGFEAGLKHERALFEDLVSSHQSKAMRHLFFAERLAGKPPRGVEGKPIALSQAGVVGAGTMGVGIALSLLAAGKDVVLFDVKPAALSVGYDRIRAVIDGDLAKGRISETEAASRRQRLTKAEDWSGFDQCDIIIEAVFEDMEIKKTVFAALAERVRADAILATNTSYLDIDELARSVPHPNRVLGLHFFSPAHIMKLLEIVRGEATSDDVLVTALALGKQMGKISVVSGVCHGFIGNRMISAYGREAGLLLLEGASPQAIDKAVTDFGMPMGPFTMADMAGLDIGYSNRKKLSPDQYETRAVLVHDQLVEMGRKGQKTGSGFYRYEDGNRTPLHDAKTDEIIAAVRTREGITPREIDAEEIVERCIFALINEGAALLGEGIAARGSDVDVVYANGYGFPRWRGGPFSYADQVGLDYVAERIASFAERFGTRWWTPAPLLIELAKSGGALATHEN